MVYICDKYLNEAANSPSGPPNWVTIRLARSGSFLRTLVGYCRNFLYSHIIKFLLSGLLVFYLPRPWFINPLPWIICWIKSVKLSIVLLIFFYKVFIFSCEFIMQL